VPMYGDEEPADFLYRMGSKYNLTESTRRAMLAMLCEDKAIYCSRPHALLYSYDVVNITGSRTCNVTFAGWRYLSPSSYIPIEAAATYWEENIRVFLQRNVDINAFLSSPPVVLVGGLYILLNFFSLYFWSCLAMWRFKSVFRDHTRLSLVSASFLVCIPLAAFYYSTSFGYRNVIDSALYSETTLLGTVKVYEHDEPADVVYEWCIQEKQARIKTVRY
jgi:hypothetical protein